MDTKFQTINSEPCSRTEAPDILIENMASSNVDSKPRVGMEFENVEEAWKIWVEYGRKIGFKVRKRYINKRKEDGAITSCRYVCCKEGHRKVDKRDVLVAKHRAETRTECKARIALCLAKNGKFVIHEFVEEHNHPLQLPETIHILASHHNHPLAVSPREACQSMDEKDMKIQELTVELRNKKRLCATYREQLIAFMKIVEDHSERLSKKICHVINNLKEFESIEKELLHQR
ncbi:hypothetical protein L6164_023863 [Bauhinia variegata]|uniref:Uncharacterized protein n=1 Tax=Bauhinia variegata TaxID=167791 RepID=A0ACB9MJH7_BAUVA|nr:hypothetical protein L6164_023863 [Bauhinia variegata]